MTNECPICGALFWYNERIGKKRKTKNPIFTMCCMRGKIKLPLLKEPPPFLIDLLTKDDAISKHFRDNIRPLNMMFSFTSLGRKIDNSINRGNGPKNFQTMGKTIIWLGAWSQRQTKMLSSLSCIFMTLRMRWKIGYLLLRYINYLCTIVFLNEVHLFNFIDQIEFPLIVYM